MIRLLSNTGTMSDLSIGMSGRRYSVILQWQLDDFKVFTQ
jgi:hypothetical protein